MVGAGPIGGGGNAADASRSLGGFFTGVHRRFGDYRCAGIAAGYTNATVQASARASSASVDTAHLAAYACASYGAWNRRSAAAVGWSNIDSSRSNMFPGFAELATARYDAGTVHMFGEAGYGLAPGRIAAEPFAGLAWTHLNNRRLQREGRLRSARRIFGQRRCRRHNRGRPHCHQHSAADGTALTLHASAGGQHAFGDLTPGAALTFQSTGIGSDIAGVPLARDPALVEGGIICASTRDSRAPCSRPDCDSVCCAVGC